MFRWTRPAPIAVGLATIAVPALALAMLCAPVFQSRSDQPGPPMSGTQWASLPDPDALENIKRLGELGDDAVPFLVPLLGDHRPTVAEAARRGLTRRLDRWQLLDSREATPRIIGLAEGLSRIVADFDPAGRQRAADLALRLLSWPLDEPDARQLIDACAVVLTAGQPEELKPDAADALSTRSAEMQALPDEITRVPTLPDRRPRPAARSGADAANATDSAVATVSSTASDTPIEVPDFGPVVGDLDVDLPEGGGPRPLESGNKRPPASGMELRR